MDPSLTVFDRTSQWYTERLSQFDFAPKANMLGVEPLEEGVRVALMTDSFEVSAKGIASESGGEVPFSETVILSNYILRCPDLFPRKGGWITWREVPGSGALAVYVGSNAVKVIETRFASDLDGLSKATKLLGGAVMPSQGSDFSARFDLLPRIPLTMHFNTADDEFPASCTLLFAEDVGAWLDTESLAILAVLFAEKLTHL